MAACDLEVGRQLAELYSLSDFRIHDPCRVEWWKRGEAPPEWVAEYEPLEWWQEGHEPPEFGCAA